MVRQLTNERATLILKQAYQLLSDQAEHLMDMTVRQSFLNNVAENAEIGALWKATSALA